MLINELDNVEVHLNDGHKYALRDISKGEHVHSHNLKTNLSGAIEYTYTPVRYPVAEVSEIPTFMGYVRENGEVGIRNDVWIVNTVGCVNKIAQALAEKKANWIDFDASGVLEGNDLTEELLTYILQVAGGEQTQNEKNGCEEISIFKDGVTL